MTANPKRNTYSDSIKVLRTSFQLYKNYRLLEFWGGIAAMLILILAVMFISVSGFIAVAAILSWFSGLILATIVEKDRQQFEFRLNLIQDEE